MITPTSAKPSFKSKLEYNKTIQKAFEWGLENPKDPKTEEFIKAVIAIQDDNKNDKITFTKADIENDYNKLLNRHDIFTVYTDVAVNGKPACGIGSSGDFYVRDSRYKALEAVHLYALDFKQPNKERKNEIINIINKAQKNLNKAQENFYSAIKLSLKLLEEDLKKKKTE